MDIDKIDALMRLPCFPTRMITVSENNGEYSFEIEVNCKANAFESWLKEFENITKTNYTIRKRSSNGQIYERSIYATCHRNTYGKQVKYGSKNTQCPAKIQMKKKKPLLNGVTTCTVISVQFNHNHPIETADSLKFRKPTKTIEEKFIKLLESGHSPGSSIKAHNLDIALENPQNYEVLLADNSLSPNYQWVYRLHKKIANSNYRSSKLTSSEQAVLIKSLAAEKDCFLEDNVEFVRGEIIENHSTTDNVNPINSTIFVSTDNMDVNKDYMDENNEDDIGVNNGTVDQSITERNIVAEENLKNIFNDLLKKFKKKPDVYLDAIQVFCQKYNNIKTDTNLISSLYCFGNTLNKSTTSTNVYAVKRKGNKIGVQPTSVSRRQHIVHLRKGSHSSINIGRPHKLELKEHKYARHLQPTKASHGCC